MYTPGTIFHLRGRLRLLHRNQTCDIDAYYKLMYRHSVTVIRKFFFKQPVLRITLMISIKNKESEQCLLMVVDMNGRVCCETYMEPHDKLTLDIRELFTGIYTLIFKTENTSYTQQIVKY